MARALVSVHWQIVKRAEMGREKDRWRGGSRGDRPFLYGDLELRGPSR